MSYKNIEIQDSILFQFWRNFIVRRGKELIQIKAP